MKQVTPVKAEDKCKHGKWRDRHFKNQGQCVSHDRHELNHARQEIKQHKQHSHH